MKNLITKYYNYIKNKQIPPENNDPEIVIGKTYVKRSFDPFKRYEVFVLDYKEEYVLFSIKGHQESLPEECFLEMYYKKESLP